MRIIHFLFFFLTSTFLQKAFSQNVYYEQRGNQVVKVTGQDPTQLVAKEWVVRLYKMNAPNSGANYWGTISGATADEVMKKLKTDQDFEISYNKFIGKGAVKDLIFTHFNPLGPIAIVDEGRSSDEVQSQYGEEVVTITQKLKEYMQASTEAKKKLDVILKGKPVTAFDNVGEVFKEYSSNLKDAIKQLLSLKKMLYTQTANSMDNIAANIESINQDFSVLDMAKNTIDNVLSKNTSSKTSQMVGGNYAYIIKWAVIPNAGEAYPSGVRSAKYVYFFSQPISYKGNFESTQQQTINSFEQFTLSQVSSINNYTGKTTFMLGSDANDPTNKFKSYNECLAEIQAQIQKLNTSYGGHTDNYTIYPANK